MVDFLNSNSGAFQVVFAFVITAATICYVILTRSLVRETKRLREVETEPQISIYLEPEERWINLMDLVIRNIGRGPAYNIRFEIDPDFEYRKGRFLSNLPFMQELHYLAPGQTIRFFLANAIDVFNRKVAGAFKITAHYENEVGTFKSGSFKIEFERFEGMSGIGEPPLYKIAKSIEVIHKDIQSFLTGFKRAKVEVWTQDDIRAEHEAIMKEYGENTEGHIPKSSL